MLFTTFSQHLQKLETQPSRLDMTQSLADLFIELDPKEVKKACYLLQGTLVPPYESQEFQLSTKMVIRALTKFLPAEKESAGLFEDAGNSKSIAAVEKLYKNEGDLGEVAFALGQSVNRSIGKQTILEVYETLTEIAFESGAGSQLRKLEKLQELLVQLDAASIKFIVRIILGKLRLGFSTMTMIDGLSWAITGGKEHRKLLEDAYQKKRSGIF